VLRRGRSVSFVGVDCTAASGLAARAILTYGAARDSDLAGSALNAPEVPEPDACPELALERDLSAPAFFAHMDVRSAAGSALLSGGEASFSMWVRHKDGGGLDPESGAVGVADVLPPAVLASATAFRPASSVTWSVDFVAPLPDPAGWYLLSSTSDHVADGYSLVALSCFDAERRLVAVGRQTQAVF
jgi:acyl-CoA thioesterase